ncbi:hypothetical protein [Algoriphagus antarcticus]|uniref:Cellulase (Glycosyl hydrolase family 5) n=1 Tax=Algoriphagus antarcticus TaxID=238540 RepID=A0A3E0E3G3_9BACT|nr:hypothetical protein [Algoriphagus antarcticus]REG92822.1 hypothetical protein C8N25_102225 [Algoriphagus antarcticus]
MNCLKTLLFAFLAFCTCSISYSQNQPIKLLFENPHYFEYNSKPTALITSAEHYGAVLNADFNFEKYLNTLHEEGMNYTRIFMASYFEIPSKSFSIKHNTLAPEANKVIVPWLTKTENGEVKYDWNTYNPVYFERLNDFMSLAQELDIIVEVTLFSSIYNDDHWEMNPQNPCNRVDGSGTLDRKLVHTTENGELFTLQKSYVTKLVNALNAFDNFFFEIQNEPWSDRGTTVLNIANTYTLDGPNWQVKVDVADEKSLEWQEAIAETIATTEAKLPKKHLIAQNYSNFKAPIASVSKHISILNFHYNWPESATWNYHWDKVIGFDESGFAGSADMVYRRQAWVFMLSGGGLFNSLDYSFFPGKEDGTGQNEAPGGGSIALRQELKILSETLHTIDLRKAHPAESDIIGAPGMIAYALSDGNEGWLAYLIEAGAATTQLIVKTSRESTYNVASINTLTGETNNLGTFSASNQRLSIPVSLINGEIALKIKALKPTE